MSRLLLLVTEGMGCALSSATLLLVAHGAAPDCPLLWAPLQGDGASPGNREASAWSRLSRPTGWAGLGALCCPPAWTFTSRPHFPLHLQSVRTYRCWACCGKVSACPFMAQGHSATCQL